MPRAGKVFDTVARTLGAVGSLATVALGALVWGFNSREAVVSSRLENLEKQSEKLAFQLGSEYLAPQTSVSPTQPSNPRSGHVQKKVTNTVCKTLSHT